MTKTSPETKVAARLRKMLMTPFYRVRAFKDVPEEIRKRWLKIARHVIKRGYKP